MDNKTITLPATYTAFSINNGSPIAAIPSATSSGITVATLLKLKGFTLYLPFFATRPPAAVDVSSLIQALGDLYTQNASTSIPVYAAFASTRPTAINTTVPEVTLSSGFTLYIPVTATLPPIVDVSLLTSALKAVSVTPLANSTSSISSKSTLPSAPSGGVPENTFEGALIGGVLGGLIIGLIACSLVLWCIRRRRSGLAAMQAGSKNPSHRKPVPRDASKDEETQIFEVATDVTGWQKHLPQEKEDGMIVKDFKSIFEQIQIHTEGFYEAKLGKPSNQAITFLERLSHDDLPKMLMRTDDAVPLLEGLLIRWIIHRISLRSDARESLLPLEYTKIPEKNKWHMESNEKEKGSTAESKKGFPQAFSRWRMLTGFLRPDPKTDQEFKRDLDVKIDQAVRALTEAFSPWDLPGKSNANRIESLRKILYQASDAGIVLFTQPSTFMFDWSSKDRGQDRTVVITPAFVKRLDEFAEPLHSAQVLIQARWASI